MSITEETAKQHAKDPAVLCCRAEEGTVIEAKNLEDPAILDELVDSGLLDLTGVLTIEQILGSKLTKTCDSLTPVTMSVIDAAQEVVEEQPVEETRQEEAPLQVMGTAQGMVTSFKGGKIVISMKEGKDIYLEFSI
ncbi:sugar transporter [Lachnospiraceae bacterium LCP25S3_G4]